MLVLLGPALFVVWWYFAPDFSRPIGQLTLADLGYLILLAPLTYYTFLWWIGARDLFYRDD
jgi:hypothetical protein